MEVSDLTFADNINRICKEKGTSLTAVVKRIKNGQSSYTTAINHRGSIPKQKELLELAKILDCSVSDFFSDEDDILASRVRDEEERDIISIYRSLSRRDQHEFMTIVYDFESRK